MYLMPSKSEPCGLSQLIAMHYGTVPIVASTGGLRDTVPPYNPETGEGRGFTFQSYNADDFLGAIDRAAGLYYGDRDAWNRLAAMIWSVTSAGRSRPTNICSCTANCSTASSNKS